MSVLKSLARQIVFPAILKTGLESFLSKGNKNKHLILMYHGVVNKVNTNLSVNHISKSDFEKQLKYLQKHFNIVSLSEIFESYRSKRHSSKLTVAVTFDDGYENNYINAFPLLKQFNMPATIFVAAQCLQNDNAILWYDLIDLFRRDINLSTTDFSKTDLNIQKKEKLLDVKSIGQLKSFFKTLTTEEKSSVVKILISDEKIKSLKEKTDSEYWKMLNASQIKEMTDSGLIEIGSHSTSHPNLDCITKDDLIFELKESKRLLENATNEKVISIAYPDGAYNDEVKKLSIELGYKNLLAVDYRLADDAGDKNILPRFCISNTTTVESNMISLHRSFSKIGF